MIVTVLCRNMDCFSRVFIMHWLWYFSSSSAGVSLSRLLSRYCTALHCSCIYSVSVFLFSLSCGMSPVRFLARCHKQ